MESETNVETKISTAMLSRMPDFKEQADSLTLEGVRRVLEKDLGLKAFALDLHKKFIKQLLEKHFNDADDENGSKSSAEKAKDTHSEKEEAAEEHERPQSQKEAEEPDFVDKENVEEPPASDGEKTMKQESEESPGLAKCESILNEDIIKKAIKKRTPYFSAHSETITFSGARRLLEEDLKLDKNALDPYRKFIREKLDEIFQGHSVVESSNGSKAKHVTKDSSNKLKHGKSMQPKKVGSDDGSLGSLASDKDGDEELGKRKRQTAKKGKAMNSEGPKKRKKLTKENKSSSDEEEESTKANETEERENLSEDDQSQSSVEEGVKKRGEVSSQVYGKRVEQLKSVIKASGMSVPPAVYKRVKQAPESKREGHLIKELEEILGREGLSGNSSEKEIKAVKKKKERAKDLEGIDLGNIVSNSRSRRATFDFMIPPKPVEPAKNDDDNEENDENTDDDTEDSDSEEASEGFNEDDDDEESD